MKASTERYNVEAVALFDITKKDTMQHERLLLLVLEVVFNTSIVY